MHFLSLLRVLHIPAISPSYVDIFGTQLSKIEGRGHSLLIWYCSVNSRTRKCSRRDGCSHALSDFKCV